MNFKEKSSCPVPKMNSTNLYVTTTNIILQADARNSKSWQDLYRLIPYLRNSLCCVVCSTLLVDPYTPKNEQCQHHICKNCKGGRKRIKPACESCKDCTDYIENRRLRILMQCYKQMCITLMNMPIFEIINLQTTEPGTGFERGAGNLITLIKEGASFQDDYKSNGGLPKSAYSILPCIYTNSSTTLTQDVQTSAMNKESHNVVVDLQVPNRTSFYSVVYPGTGNKITLKRKPRGNTVDFSSKISPNRLKNLSIFKKPCNIKLKKGCRCGNATATPGKLTCCGQRCPCYVDSKPCSECRCRGCRNPHQLDGQKMVPRILDIQIMSSQQAAPPPLFQPQIRQQAQIAIPTQSQFETKVQPDNTNVGMELETQFTTIHHEPFSINKHYKAYKVMNGYSSNISELIPVGFNQTISEESISVS